MTSNSARPVVAIGEILVEIMAETAGDGFREPLALRGPYPSGAPAIFIDQVAKLGQPAAMISAVGDDDFGRLNVERLSRDGVDVALIRVEPGCVTGSAFVRYRPDGERDFVFNIRDSAAGRTRLGEDGAALLRRGAHLHVMGSSLFARPIVDDVLRAVGIVKENGGTVSFDPNVRKELLGENAAREALGAVLRRCDLFLPSGDELLLLTEATVEEEAIAEILGFGVEAVAVKRGRDGASWHDRNGTIRSAAFAVDEVDPTGAGDCFGATAVACRLQGRPVADTLRLASASGALAVGVRGPMEGTSTLAELERFVATRSAAG